MLFVTVLENSLYPIMFCLHVPLPPFEHSRKRLDRNKNPLTARRRDLHDEVAARSQHRHAEGRGRREQAGQGAQHIVSLKARCHAQGEVELRTKDLLELFKVLEEHLRCHIPVRLVVGIRLVAKGGLGGVKSDYNPLRLQAFPVVLSFTLFSKGKFSFQ